MEPQRKLKITYEKLIFSLKELAIILGLSLNQAAAYLAFFIWKLEILYYIILILFFSLSFSAYKRELGKSIAYSLISAVVGVIIGLGIVIMPFAVNSDIEMMNLMLNVYIMSISKPFVVNMVVCIFSPTLSAFFVGGM